MLPRDRSQWKELSPLRRRALVVLAVVQLSLAAGAWLDLARRGRDQVVGNKRTWALVIGVNFVGPVAYFLFGRRPAESPLSAGERTDSARTLPATAEAPAVIESHSITVEVADSASPVTFPVTTASVDGIVQAVVIGEYGPVAGTAPEGLTLRSTVLRRWPRARVFERRSAVDSGADPRSYESFYLELCADGRRREVDADEVARLLHGFGQYATPSDHAKTL